MLATILKSPKAIETTIAIIKTFAQIKQLTQSIYQLAEATDEQKVKILENGTEIIAEFLSNELMVSGQETNITIKLPFLEINRKVTKTRK